MPSGEAAALASATTLLGLLAIATGRSLARGVGVITAFLLVAGLLYGLVYGGVIEARTAQRLRAFEAAAAELAPLARPDVPLVVQEGTDRRFTWPLAHRLDRVLEERAPGGPHDVVGAAGAGPSDARLVAESGGFALWQIDGER
jgi:hypothetical protein